jgi:hypothetical protein
MADPDIARVSPRRINGPDNSLIIPSFHLDHKGRESSQATPHQVKETSMDLEPNLGVALD